MRPVQLVPCMPMLAARHFHANSKVGMDAQHSTTPAGTPAHAENIRCMPQLHLVGAYF